MTYSKKEVQTFAARCDKLEKDAGTELSRQGQLASEISLRKGWSEDDLKGKGEGRAFFVECLEVRGVKVTPQNVERYTLSAHPQVVKLGFKKIMDASYAIRDKNPGSRINNVQEAMLREARTGVSLAKVKEQGGAAAKSDAASNAKRGGGTPAFKSRADLVTHINASIKRKLVSYYGKDKAESLYTEVCIRANDLPNSKPYKKPAKK